jgi:predicted Zn-dependent peptidase
MDEVQAPLAPAPLLTPNLLVRRRKTEQAHICFGMRAPSYLHPDRYAIDLLNTVLGEGMSSRLFLNIRERLGLAYDVHSFTQKHRDTGYLALYMRKLREEEVLPEELQRAKEFTKGRLRLELETTNGVAFWLSYQELLLGEIRTVDDEVAQIDAVTAADIKRVANEVFQAPMQMAVIGPFARTAGFRVAIGA